jgi:cytochrome c oxidase subunit 4
MTDMHGAEPHGEDHGGSGVKPYLVVFGALVVFTLISFVVNSAERSGSVSREAGFAIILGVAVCKAVLVGVFFMHLMFDWRKLYFIIIPVAILGSVLVVVLLPDIVLAWRHQPPANTAADHAP